MKQLTLQHGVLLTLAALATPVLAATSAEAQVVRSSVGVLAGGTITGIIRDSDGVPQMGALVQALLPDTSIGASAITDSRGRYRFNVQPGRYRITATAALFLPAVRERLQVTRGGRTIVDLTLATLLAPAGWLPASRRSVNEPSDDWMWTLRSSASRPILRYNDSDTSSSAGNAETEVGEDGAPIMISSSREGSGRRGISGGRVTVKNNDGGFARGGNHNVLVLTRVNEDGSGGVLRADLSGSRTPYPVAPSAEISAGIQRRTPLNGYSRAVLTYISHPELTTGGATGMQGATLRSAERIEVGDLLRIDAGSVMRESNLGGNALVVEPFFRVSAHAVSGIVVAYSMTRSRGTESIEDLDRVQAQAPVAVMRNGHLRLETGSHHALSVAKELPGHGVIEVAIYHDQLNNPMISGSGTLGASELQTDGLTADPTTSTYRVAAQNFSSSGVRASFRQPVTKALSAGAEVATGNALKASLLQNASMNDVLNGLNPSRIYAATVFADGKILHTGTTVRASYRWQPVRSLTPVDAFRVGDDGAYLSCSVRQSLGSMRFLPQGLEAVVDLQNLLAEGYQPFLSNDGQTLYLAQTPRTIQAGLSFSF